MKPKIGLITLGVSDLKASTAFYRDGLGFPTHEFDEGAGIVFFKLEGTWLAIFPREKLAEDAAVPVQGSGFSGFTIAHNEVSKEKVDETYALFLQAGARAAKPPHDTVWGGYSGYAADPDGYLWEIAHNPFTDLT